MTSPTRAYLATRATVRAALITAIFTAPLWTVLLIGSPA